MFWKILLIIYIATTILALFEMLSLSLGVANCVKSAYEEENGYGNKSFPRKMDNAKVGFSAWVNLFVVCAIPLLNAFLAFGIIFCSQELEDSLLHKFWIFPDDENYNSEDYLRFWNGRAED